MKASRPHDESVVKLLKDDHEFAAVYLAAALDEADQPGGQYALLSALRQIAEAQGMGRVAKRAGIPRESLYRALSPRGNPTLKTLLSLLNAVGLRLGVFERESVIRECVLRVIQTWSALEPTDPKQPSKNTLDDSVDDAARTLIEDFCLRQDLGQPQSPESLGWLAEALSRILEHKDPLHSLGLMARPSSRPVDTQTAFDSTIWVRCAEALGYSRAEAIARAAETFAKDIKTVERYRKVRAERATEEIAELAVWQRYFSKVGRKPLPPAKKDEK